MQKGRQLRITDFICKKPKCIGCKYELPEQEAHSDCPDGCLHNPLKCSNDCSVSKNLTHESNMST